jgi:hypothetical protein
MITKYVVDRQAEDAANATINREQAALRRMYRLASEKLGGYCPPIRMLEENNVRQGFFERPEFEAVLASLPAELKPVFEVAYITGWRIKSEILTRQKNHLDLTSGWMRPAAAGVACRAGARRWRYAQVRREDRTYGAVALPS